MVVQTAGASVAIRFDCGCGSEHTVEAETDIHRRTADRALRGNERESADAGEKRRGHIDSADPTMRGRIARSNLCNELDAAERKDESARSEMNTDPGRGRRRVAFIQARQTLVPLRQVPSDE